VQRIRARGSRRQRILAAREACSMLNSSHGSKTGRHVGQLSVPVHCEILGSYNLRTASPAVECSVFFFSETSNGKISNNN